VGREEGKEDSSSGVREAAQAFVYDDGFAQVAIGGKTPINWPNNAPQLAACIL